MGKPVRTTTLTTRQDEIRDRALKICEAEHAAWLTREHWDRACFELELEEMKGSDQERTNSRKRSG
ncbi:MAG: hypothetical protein R3D05_20050 [Dongiaceae bacterium]